MGAVEEGGLGAFCNDDTGIRVFQFFCFTMPEKLEGPSIAFDAERHLAVPHLIVDD